jgi:hypothetical protein
MTGTPLTRTQGIVLGTTMLGMLAIGAAGAYGTYNNLTTAYTGPTALGAVAAGEGATLILALGYVGLVMLGQGAPRTVRACLWLLPAVGSALGAAAAHGARTTVIYAATPLAMVAAAEGVGLLARRIVVRTTGVDAEAERRAASAVRRLAYEQARAARHPLRVVRWVAELRAWRIARHVGADDTTLGGQLLDVQRARLAQGADAALSAMFAPAVTPGTPDRDAVTAHVTPALDPAPETADEQAPEPETGTGVTGTGTQASDPQTLAEIATVTGVPTPVPGEPLSTPQLAVVLRWLRYQTDPPLSYRAARAMFRELGFVGAEDRVRPAWAALDAAEADTTR